MLLLHDFFAVVTSIAYGIAASAAFRQLYINNRRTKSLTYLIIFAFTVHTITFAWHFWHTGNVPLYSLPDSIITLTWALVLSLLIAGQVLDIKIFSAFLLPLVFMLLVVSVSLPDSLRQEDLLGFSGLAGHVIITLLGYIAFAMASIASIMYLVQENQLRNKVFDALYRKLPSLEELDRLSFQLVLLGLPLLSLAIFLGFVGAKSVWRGSWPFDAKIVWTFLTWGIYTAYIMIKVWTGWGGKKAAWIVVIGFISVLWNMFVVNTMFTEHHLY